MRKIIVVDGCMGQDASYLIKHLIDEGSEVIGVTRRSGSSTNWRHEELDIVGKFKLEYCDINEPHSVDRLIKKYKPNEYYHLAAQSFVKDSFDNPYSTVFTNAIGTMNVIESIKTYSPETRLYNASTCLPAGTKILAKRQYERVRNGKVQITESLTQINIEDLKEGDTVLSMDMETSKKESCKILGTSSRVAEDMYELNFDNGNYLRLSGNHPVYIIDKGWIPADNLMIGDETIHKKCASLVNIKRKGKTNENIYGKEKSEIISSNCKKGQRNSVLSGTFKGNGWKDKTIDELYNENDVKKIRNNMSEGQKNSDYPSWNFGLTAKTDKRLEKVGKKISEAHIKLWSNSDYAVKMMKAFKKVFNKQEQKFLKLLDDNFDHNFLYNGDGRILNIDGKLPDFVDLKRKKLIEFNGDYWHRNDVEGQREAFFASKGYETLIVWQSELKNDIDGVIQKVKTFMYNPDVELSKITTIKKVKPERVYDIEVEKNHNFFANCILVHNSEMFGRVLETPQKETTPFNPVSPYGAAKNFAHNMIKIYRESYGLYMCSGLLFNHESRIRGEEFVTKKITKGIVNWFKTGEVITLGNLDAKRDWGHASDYVKAQILMLRQKEPKDYVIASGQSISIREFITKCLDYLNIEYVIEGEGINEVIKDIIDRTIVKVLEEFYRPNEVDTLLGDSTKARTELGWVQEYDLDGLIKDMIDFELEK